MDKKKYFRDLAISGFIKKGHKAVWYTETGHYFTSKEQGEKMAKEMGVELFEELAQTKKKSKTEQECQD